MRKLFYGFMALSAMMFTACDDDDDEETNGGGSSSDVIKSGEITSDETWTSDNVYVLDGRVAVTNNATLTIEPGTVVKGNPGQQANASVLIIARDGQIQANGTADAPIIFTSSADDIAADGVTGDIEVNNKGLWGGVLILGEAEISADAQSVQIEGIPPSDPNGLYGGTDNSHSSGSFTYCSIRFGGTLLGEGNEINGLTLGGVGSGTTIENVEVVGNLDDGIECFGGSVNITNALVWNQGDDAYDIDQAYSGTIDNFVFKGDATSDHGLEIDGPEGSLEGMFTLRNGTMIGYNENGEKGGEYADFRDGAMGSVENVYFQNFSETSDYELDDSLSVVNYIAGDLSFSSLEFNTSHLSAGNRTVADIFVDDSDLMTPLNPFSNIDPATYATVTGSATVGADLSVFANWTLGSATGQL